MCVCVCVFYVNADCSHLIQSFVSFAATDQEWGIINFWWGLRTDISLPTCGGSQIIMPAVVTGIKRLGSVTWFSRATCFMFSSYNEFIAKQPVRGQKHRASLICQARRYQNAPHYKRCFLQVCRCSDLQRLAGETINYLWETPFLYVYECIYLGNGWEWHKCVFICILASPCWRYLLDKRSDACPSPCWLTQHPNNWIEKHRT